MAQVTYCEFAGAKCDNEVKSVQYVTHVGTRDKARNINTRLVEARPGM